MATRIERFLLISFFSLSIFTTEPSTAIFVMGASCSGKSTLAHRLLQSYDNNQWKLVELDAIEDEFKTCGKSTENIDLIHAVVEKSNTLLAAGYNVIIDTNLYHDILRTISAKNKKYILIHCPLNILLKRNSKRDIVLKRTAQRSIRAREYVEKTFENFKNFEKCDVRLDSSTSDIDAMVLDIKRMKAS